MEARSGVATHLVKLHASCTWHLLPGSIVREAFTCSLRKGRCTIIKNEGNVRPDAMAHTCNPRFSGGRRIKVQSHPARKHEPLSEK
jgi:hypothetical protein